MTPSGEAFLTHYLPYNPPLNYALDRTAKRWNEVAFPGSDPMMTLEGSENETLVFEDTKGLAFFDPLQSLANR